MSRVSVIGHFISALNNASFVEKEVFYIKNTPYTENILKLLYSKNYFIYYTKISPRVYAIRLNYAFFKPRRIRFVQVSRPSCYVFAKSSSLRFFFKRCHPLSYTVIVSSNLGFLFLEDAIRLNVGGLLICYIQYF